MRFVIAEIGLVVLLFGLLTVCEETSVPPNGTTYEEVVVETSLYVKRKPETALRRQRLTFNERGAALRTRREISHSTSHSGSQLKINALNSAAGHEKQSQSGFDRAYFDKGFSSGASKAAQRTFYKQRPAGKQNILQ